MPAIGRVKGMRLEERSMLSNQIRKLRLSNGWTQREMAAATGIPKVCIAYLENIPKNKPNQIPPVYYQRIKNWGYDLAELVPDLIITDNRRGRRSMVGEEDAKIQIKRDKYSKSMSKIMSMLNSQKNELESRIASIDAAIKKAEDHATALMAEAEDLRIRKERLKEKVHKIELSIDNARMSMLEDDDEISTSI